MISNLFNIKSPLIVLLFLICSITACTNSDKTSNSAVKDAEQLQSIYKGDYSTQVNELSFENRRQILPTLVQIDSTDKFEVKFNVKGNRTGVAVFSKNKVGWWNLAVKSKSETRSIPYLIHLFKEVAVVDLYSDGNEFIFFVGWDGGSAYQSIYLYLLNPATSDFISYELSFVDNAAKPLPEITTSDNYFDDKFQKERELLESIKYEYGFISEEDILQSKKPKFAYFYWMKDNANTEDGIMQVRKYEGHDTNKSSLLIEIEDSSMIYNAYFKAGVIAYDKNTDEHFVLFHPDSIYSHPTVLKKYGHYLIIGTGGEGLVIVNVDNFHFKRYTNENNNLENMTVSKIDIVNLKIIINDSEKLDLPTF